MTVRFSAADLADAGDLAAILRGWADEMPWMPKLHSPPQDLGFLAHLIATSAVTKATIDNRPAGFLAREGAEVSCLYLSPFARGRGIGAQLLEQAKAARPRLELWTFQANPGARRFYARHGFVEAFLTDGADNEERLPDVRLFWQRGTACG